MAVPQVARRKVRRKQAEQNEKMAFSRNTLDQVEELPGELSINLRKKIDELHSEKGVERAPADSPMGELSEKDAESFVEKVYSGVKEGMRESGEVQKTVEKLRRDIEAKTEELKQPDDPLTSSSEASVSPKRPGQFRRNSQEYALST